MRRTALIVRATGTEHGRCPRRDMGTRQRKKEREGEKECKPPHENLEKKGRGGCVVWRGKSEDSLFL